MPEVNTALRIRAYRPEDHAAVVALNAYGLTAAGVKHDAYAGVDLADVAATYGADAGGALLVGEVDGELAAMGGLRRHTEDTCEIMRMRVWPAHQRRGYGRAMLAALEASAVRLGYRQARLLTGEFQHPAIDLYHSAGYQVASRQRMSGLPSVYMVKRLPG